ncbi:MAG TPA: cyclic nucleotide-binding domain-containing protein [Bacteroidota bacterium]|nr:cyclic nucleotide-binding domain-containing protein [Bacteroidota bacterium]
MGVMSFFGIGKQEGRKVRFRDTLRSIPIFSELGRRELAAVERILHKREYQAGEIIFRQDEPGLGMYIIESGRVSIRSDDAIDKMTELGDGEFFGELPLLDGGSRSASAIAKTACRIFGFFQPDLFGLIERDPRLGVKIVLSLAAIIGMRLRAANERVQALLQQNIAAAAGAAGKQRSAKKS